MKNLLLSCFSTALLFLQAGYANALSITQTSAFSGTSTVPGALSALTSVMGVTPFDPSLGTLNEVRVSISGQTHVDFNAHIQYFGGGVTPPRPYSVQIVNNNLFTGNGGYFSFDSPAESGWVVIADYTDWSFDNIFTYDFIFNDVTDLTGTTIPIVTNTTDTIGTPPSISGQLADFVAFPGGSVTFVQTSLALVWTEVNRFDVTTTGSMAIEYDYTPASPSSAPVPEPATMLLFGTGLAGLAGSRIRRKK